MNHLYWFQQQAGAEETGKTGEEPQHGDVLSEPLTRPHGHAAGQGDPRPTAPQGSTAARRGKPAGTAHICHNWRRGREDGTTRVKDLINEGKPSEDTATLLIES